MHLLIEPAYFYSAFTPEIKTGAIAARKNKCFYFVIFPVCSIFALIFKKLQDKPLIKQLTYFTYLFLADKETKILL
jgi:hypothetical protein